MSKRVGQGRGVKKRTQEVIEHGEEEAKGRDGAWNESKRRIEGCQSRRGRSQKEEEDNQRFFIQCWFSQRSRRKGKSKTISFYFFK